MCRWYVVPPPVPSYILLTLQRGDEGSIPRSRTIIDNHHNDSERFTTTTNTSFPLDLSKQLWLEVKTGKTAVIIYQSEGGYLMPSRPLEGEGEGQDKGSAINGRGGGVGSVTFESTWSGKRDHTTLTQGLLFTRLEVEVS
jgi:hypothetical protein